jgi:methionyl aminopeptidase
MIILKTPAEIDVMAQASKVVAEALEVVRNAVRPGVTTDDLDHIAEQAIRARGVSRHSKDTVATRRPSVLQ